MSKKETLGTLRCSFCEKSQLVVKKLIAGPGVYICDECIDLCNSIIAEDKEKDVTKTGQLKYQNQEILGCFWMTM